PNHRARRPMPPSRRNWSLCRACGSLLYRSFPDRSRPALSRTKRRMQTDTIRIGTRGSALALAQAHETRARLMAAHGLPEEAFEVVVISTSGDRIQDRPLSEAGGKGLFTKEIEEALLDGRIDLAVHSSKDMPTLLPEGLELSAFLP